MAVQISVVGLIPYSYLYLRSAMVRFPFELFTDYEDDIFKVTNLHIQLEM